MGRDSVHTNPFWLPLLLISAFDFGYEPGRGGPSQSPALGFEVDSRKRDYDSLVPAESRSWQAWVTREAMPTSADLP